MQVRQQRVIPIYLYRKANSFATVKLEWYFATVKKLQWYFEICTHSPLQRAIIDMLSTRLRKTETIRDIQICVCTCHAYAYTDTCIFVSVIAPYQCTRHCTALYLSIFVCNAYSMYTRTLRANKALGCEHGKVRTTCACR